MNTRKKQKKLKTGDRKLYTKRLRKQSRKSLKKNKRVVRVKKGGESDKKIKKETENNNMKKIDDIEKKNNTKDTDTNIMDDTSETPQYVYDTDRFKQKIIYDVNMYPSILLYRDSDNKVFKHGTTKITKRTEYPEEDWINILNDQIRNTNENLELIKQDYKVHYTNPELEVLREANKKIKDRFFSKPYYSQEIDVMSYTPYSHVDRVVQVPVAELVGKNDYNINDDDYIALTTKVDNQNDNKKSYLLNGQENDKK